MTKTNLENRIGLIDEVRGFAIICMVVYHGAYDMITFLGVQIPFFHHPLMNFIRDLFAFGFIFISGAAGRFSRSNLKRGAVCFGLGLLMSLVTAVVVPEEMIWFGILHCLGVCMMLFPVIVPLLDRLPAAIGCAVLLLLFLATYQLPEGHLGIEGILSFDLPAAAYRSEWLFWLGLPNPAFASSDYFPLLPWMFAFFLGAYFGRYLKNGSPPQWMKKTHLRPLAFVGRHTIWIYLAHQPVLFLLFSLLTTLMRG